MEPARDLPHPAARASASYAPRQPQTTALYQVMQDHLGTFLQCWQDDADGRCLPRHVTAELREFLTCGIAQHGFTHLHCDACQARHVVPFSCKGRGLCPSCGGRRMNEGAANLVDHVLPSGVAIRQFVLTLPFALRFPLAFDARLFSSRLPPRQVMARSPSSSATRRSAKTTHCLHSCWGFNLHAATRVHGNDKQGRAHLCRYILRPPLANDRLHILPGNKVELAFKRPWSDGTSAIVLNAQALIARLAAIVPPPRRHTTRYFGVLSSHSALRPLIVPAAAAVQQEPAASPAEPAPADSAGAPAPKPVRTSKYIPWRELLRRTFGIDLRCLRCHGHLRLIALVKEEATITKILGAMGLDTKPPLLASARAPPHQAELAWGI